MEMTSEMMGDAMDEMGEGEGEEARFGSEVKRERREKTCFRLSVFRARLPFLV